MIIQTAAIKQEFSKALDLGTGGEQKGGSSDLHYQYFSDAHHEDLMNEFNVSLKIHASAAALFRTYIFLQCGHFAKVLNLSSIHCKKKKKRGGGEQSQKVEKNASILLHVKCHRGSQHNILILIFFRHWDALLDTVSLYFVVWDFHIKQFPMTCRLQDCLK